MLETPLEPTDSPGLLHDEMLEALVAGEGFRRVAEIAEDQVGAPVLILVPRPGSDGSDGGRVERYVAALVAGEEPPRPAEVAELVPIRSRGEIHGAVLMLGPGATGALEYLRVAAIAALTGVALLNARDDAAESSPGALLAELLADEPILPGEVVRRARLRGCDLSNGFAALCLLCGDLTPRRLTTAVAAARPDALAEARGGRIHVLVPGTVAGARALAKRVGKDLVSAHSSPYRQAADAGHALREAEMLATMALESGYPNAERKTWDSLRLIYRSYLADPEELTRFAEETVGPLVRHDRRHGTELEATFWAYQQSNCNMNRTAKATFTHRHTVANRLARIEELTELDPNRGYDRDLLSMALKAHLVTTWASR